MYSQADLTDIDAFKESLDSTLFPGVSSSIQAHSGFAKEQAKYVKCYIHWGFLIFWKKFAETEFQERRRKFSQLLRPLLLSMAQLGWQLSGTPLVRSGYNSFCKYMRTNCIGAAIALLDAVYLPLHISGVSFRMIGYGMPRVCAIFRQSTQSRLIFHSCSGWESRFRKLYWRPLRCHTHQ